jgi:hypothetical protein
MKSSNIDTVLEIVTSLPPVDRVEPSFEAKGARVLRELELSSVGGGEVIVSIF